MTSVLIVGIAKSGTTAIYSMTKKAMGDCLSILEPSQPGQFEFIHEDKSPEKVIKILIGSVPPEAPYLQGFDRNVLIVRDPRDVLVSWLLYKPLLADRHKDQKFIKEFTELLRRKEDNPDKVSILEIEKFYDGYNAPAKTEAGYQQEFAVTQTFERALPDCFVMTYDAIVERHMSQLETYLGFQIDPASEHGSNISFNARQKKSGGWRDWFTPEDIAYFKPIFEPFLERYGFDPDWSLSSPQTLNPAYGSEYVSRNAERLMHLPNRFGKLLAKDFYTSEYVDHLLAARQDGAEGAMVELGLAHLAGFGVEQSNAEFERFLVEAIERRNATGMIYYALALEHGLVSSQLTPKDLFGKVGAAIGNRKAKERIVTAKGEFARILEHA